MHSTIVDAYYRGRKRYGSFWVVFSSRLQCENGRVESYKHRCWCWIAAYRFYLESANVDTHHHHSTNNKSHLKWFPNKWFYFCLIKYITLPSQSHTAFVIPFGETRGETQTFFFFEVSEEKPWFISKIHDKIFQKQTSLVSLQQISENSNMFDFIVVGEFVDNLSSQFPYLFKFFEMTNNSWIVYIDRPAFELWSFRLFPRLPKVPDRRNPMVDFFLAYLPS